MRISGGPFTLRVIPDLFKTVLFVHDGGLSSPQSLWDLDPRRIAHYPCDLGVIPIPGASETTEIRNHRQEWFSKVSMRAGREKRVPTRHSGADVATVSHSAERVAQAIVLATSSPTDLRTLNAWGQHVGVSRGALRVWCKAANASARGCLDFLRVLRAVVVSQKQPWDLLSVLDVVDQRTLTQLLDRGSVRQLCRRGRPSVHVFLAHQRYIRDERLVQAVARHMTNARTVSARDPAETAPGAKRSAKKARRQRTP